jgi:hypothetical protein
MEPDIATAWSWEVFKEFWVRRQALEFNSLVMVAVCLDGLRSYQRTAVEFEQLFKVLSLAVDSSSS